MSYRNILIAVLLLSAAPCFGQQTFSIPIHATPQGNALYIEATLNGHPAILLLDTGSTFSECDVRICGRAHKAIASLAFGQWSKAGHEVTTRDFAEVSKQTGVKVDGILGLLTMNLFRKVTFNFESSMLEFQPR